MVREGLLTLALANSARNARPFERFTGCRLEPDEWTDGDSARVRLPDGRLETLRLYFVDTTESRSRGRRSDAQAAYFGITHRQAIKLGQRAKEFTGRALEKPFTIYTRWRLFFGSPRFSPSR
jgi:endonuclease YncB( thermonuclease family)